jgi:hypothetical protein
MWTVALRGAASAATALLALAMIAEQPAYASAPDRTIQVALGAHRFDRLTAPDAVVAQASADQVGWYEESDNQFGPWSFKIANDGGVWLLDQVNNRLLVWQHGNSGRVARTVPLPESSFDFTLARDTVYVLTVMGRTTVLHALTQTGQQRWQQPVGTGTAVRLTTGPDGVIYQQNFDALVPLVTASGTPLSVEQQQRQIRHDLPTTDGGKVVTTKVSDHEYRVTHVDKAGKAIRTWRITTTDNLEPGPSGSPGMAGTDPVAYFLISRRVPAPVDQIADHLFVRLTADGFRTPVVQDTVQWGDTLVTDFVIANGALYQLRTSRTTGVTIVRYSLVASASPTASPSGGGAGGGAPATTAAPSGSATPSPTASSEPTAAPPASGSSAWWWTGAGLGLAALAAAIWVVFTLRRRRRA